MCGRDQADEPDHADGGDAGRGQQRGDEEHHEPHPLEADPDQPRRVLVESEQVELASYDPGEREGNGQHHGDRDHLVEACGRRSCPDSQV